MLICVNIVCEPFGSQLCALSSTAACCDNYGNFLTTAFSCHTLKQPSFKKVLGYCKAGECAAHVCNTEFEGITLNVFCGSSKLNPCKASCSNRENSACYDTAMFLDGGENLEDGAVCVKDLHAGQHLYD